MKIRERRRRTLGNTAIFLGLAALGWALVRPGLEARARTDRLGAAQAAVAAVRQAVEAHLREEGRYPTGASTGTIPDALTPYLAPGLTFTTPEYLLGVQRWPRLERPPLPPGFDPQDSVRVPEPYLVDVGAIAVVSRDSTLLATLLEQYGRETSFVRDTTWTLLLEEAPRDPDTAR